MTYHSKHAGECGQGFRRGRQGHSGGGPRQGGVEHGICVFPKGKQLRGGEATVPGRGDGYDKEEWHSGRYMYIVYVYICILYVYCVLRWYDDIRAYVLMLVVCLHVKA